MTTVFVFGSNLQGRHGKGAAKEARLNWGAVYGIAEGLQGNSYAIPTKSSPWQTLPLRRIKDAVDRFVDFAYKNKQTTFKVTVIGCGLAGYTPEDIAPMFALAPDNCILPQEFVDVLQNSSKTSTEI